MANNYEEEDFDFEQESDPKKINLYKYAINHCGKYWTESTRYFAGDQEVIDFYEEKMFKRLDKTMITIDRSSYKGGK